MISNEQAEQVNVPANRSRFFKLIWSWENTALSVLLILAAVLRLTNLDQNGYANTYYSAAVKSMLTSWHNFFFVSFDSAGFVSVDKPPLALWVQAISAKILGFSGFSLILPQALAGIGAVALIYYLVRRSFSPLAGLIAGLVLALTPVSVAVDRDNTVDSILVVFMLLAAWAFIRAAETDRLRWLLLGGSLVGLGFNVKMIEAFMVLPVFYLVYLLASKPARWFKRAVQLALVSVVILVVAFSWATIVDLTPTDQRPYVGSSSTNSVYNLIFGYNGLGRQTGASGNLNFGADMGDFTPPAGLLEELPAGVYQELQRALGSMSSQLESEPGVLRLFNQDLAGQVSWLIPLALLGVLALAWREKWQFPLNRRQQQLGLWSGWLIICGIVFSFDSGIFHSYYLVMLAPPVAALSGAGLARMWEDWQSKDWRGWLLPAAIAITTLYAVYISNSYSDWNAWLLPLIAVTGGLACLGLIAFRIFRRFTWAVKKRPLQWGVAVLCLVAILIGPVSWALTPVLAEGNGLLPEANPELLSGQGQNFGQLLESGYDIDKLVKYLEANREGTSYLVATENATSAAPIILNSGQAVMAMGGFLGSDPILTVDKLVQMVKDGQIKFFLVQSFAGMPGQGQNGSFPGFAGTGSNSSGQTALPGENSSPTSLPGGFGSGNQQQLTDWIQKQCKVVDASQWGGQTSQANSAGASSSLPFTLPGGGQTLYDCGPVR